MIDTEIKEASARDLVLIAARAADDKKATDIIILEMAGILDITDYFLICGGATDRQTKTIADEIQKKLREHGRKPHRSAGEELGDWILLDYVDFIIHIFTDETREYYRLERLWKDAPQLKMPDVRRSQAR